MISQFRKGEKLKFLFFWGHRVAKDKSITKSCFSQWWKCKFVVDNITYYSAEHWMMAEKARLFNDEAILQKILEVKSPAHAKKLGRQILGFKANAWDEHKFSIVVKGNYHKFSQNEELKTFLLNTKKRVLVEASPVDAIWGIGMVAENEHASNPLKWKGENLLGYALMEVRDKLTKKKSENGN